MRRNIMALGMALGVVVFSFLGTGCNNSDVNNAINEFADIWHYKCDKTPCSVGYILSYVASYYEEVQNNHFLKNPQEWKDNYINTHD